MIMGEGQTVVSAFLQGLCKNLDASVATSDLPLAVKEELKNLLHAFFAIEQIVLEAAEENLNNSKALVAWLCDLKEAAYDADDVLERLALQDPEVNDAEVMVRPSCLILSCSSSLQHPGQKMVGMIKAIRRRVEKLVKKQPKRLGFQRTTRLSGNTEITPFEPRADEDREKLTQLLISGESSSHVDLSLIAIVGREGVGKTTLAQIVYGEHRVASHFQLKMWVTASEVYDARMLLRSIGESAAGFPFVDSITKEEVVNIMKDRLVRSRYLLILDDVRNEVLDWEMLVEQLKDGLSGSKIVITTETEEIAKKMRLPFLSYHLQGLSHGGSWSLFKEYTLLLDQRACQHRREIEQVGLEIVARLEGLPLAIRMIGCLLCLNFDLHDWKMILNADVWRYKSEDLYGIPAALWLSYQHLPPHIKQCFGYCSIFPRNHKFDKQSTVHMWIAQGLIQPQQGKEMEDLGNEYFDYLLNRSFFQSLSFGDKSVEYEPLVFSRTEFSVDYTRPKSSDLSEEYLMHGLIRDLALSITAYESLDLSPVACNMKKNVRHLSLQSDKDTIAEVLDLGMLHNLRTLLLYRTNNSSFDYDALFVNLKCIRVLCLSDIGLINLPNSIGNLKLLRCLDLTKTSVDTVPPVLCSLRNLQTLKLSISSSFLQPLPRDMSNLINLRHLVANGSNEMYKIGKLTSLQELEDFTVLKKDGHRIEELKNMKQLRGKLCISQLENVHTRDEAMEAKLNEKEHIRKLELTWSWDYTWDGCPIESNLAALEGLRPYANLKDLIIRYNCGAKIPTWLEDGSLSSLQTLEILDCRNWDLSLLGQLKSLKILRLDGLLETQYVHPHNSGEDDQLFPCLCILDMRRCSSFIDVPLTLEAMRLHMMGLPTLPRLHQSRSSTSSSSLASLQISQCQRLTNLQEGLLAHQSQEQLQTLHNLVIQDCYELVHLPDHGFSALVSLKTLRIENCPKLRHKPGDDSSATLPSSLNDFKVIRCAALTSNSFFIGMGRLQCLSSMVIKSEPAVDEEDRPPERVPVFTSLAWDVLQHLKSLNELQIVDCEWLEMLGLQTLVSLKRLKIAGCPRLTAYTSPSNKSPMLLEYLEIKESSLQILHGELLQSLINLRELKVMQCGELVNFPDEMEEGLHCLVSLKRLFIHQCNRLQSLPCELAAIPSLEEICITECSSLRSMPEKGLPASLFMLVIKDCRYLKQRCKKDGEDWSKISHAFYIEIDNQNVNEGPLSETVSSEEYISVSTVSDWDYPPEP